MNSVAGEVVSAFERRLAPLLGLADDAAGLALACRDMAERFAAGGRLLVFGSGAGATDAAHVAVEFVHPVIVGKRALSALALSGDAAVVSGVAEGYGLAEIYAHQVRALSRPSDIALGLCSSESQSCAQGLRAARQAGLLTIALTGPAGIHDVDHCVAVASEDPLVVKEVHVSAYHVLWELVHVFLESSPARAPAESATESSGLNQLYPFLYGGQRTTEELLAVAADSARQKLAEVVKLRRDVGSDQSSQLSACAAHLAAAFDAGGTLYAFGNGGSATDAQALVHAFLNPSPLGRLKIKPLPAVCLAADVSVLTALSNDVGFEVTFSRQIKAFGRPGDIAVGISTSGGSANVLAGLEEARRLGMATVGLAGYDGGRMADAGRLDHLFAVPSPSVHRIQEVQTTVYHVLWEATAAMLQGS
jgi:D-sedoheptulose 7-phosphate isomerase